MSAPFNGQENNHLLFDAEWYLQQNPDVAEAGIDPLEHYMVTGWREGRDPHPMFDTSFYLEKNPDVAASGENPLVQYYLFGWKEGRQPHPTFDPIRHSERYTKISKKAANLAAGPVYQGQREGEKKSAKSQLNEVESSEQKEDRIEVDKAVVLRSYRNFDFGRQQRFLDKIEQLYQSDHKTIDQTRVSIILPTFNRAGVIVEAIKSVQAQNHSNWELLIVDDGSTDSTADVVRSFVADPRIKYLPDGRRGVSSARNRGLLASTGAVIAYIDSDNTWAPNFLRTMITFLASQNLDAAYSAIEAYGDSEADSFYRGDIFVWSACLKSNYIDLNCFVHKRSLCFDGNKPVELFDTELARLVDWDLILRATADRLVSYAPFVGVRYYDGNLLNRITKSEYVNGELPAFVDRIKQKHSFRRENVDSIDTGAGIAMSNSRFEAANPTCRYKVRFFPDYRISNPYQSLLYKNFADYDVAAGTIDESLKLITSSREPNVRVIFHLHWLTPIFAPAKDPSEAEHFVDLFLARARLFVALGGRILWTVHNVVSHEPKYLEQEVRLSRGVVELAEKIHVHHVAAANFTKPYYELPADKLLVAEHGNYVGTIPITMSREEARAKLGVPPAVKVFLFLGQIREYKGVDDLLEAYSKVASDSRVGLIIAGKVLGVNQSILKEKISKLPNAIFRPGFVPDDEMQIYLLAADVMVLPYKNVLTSGSVLLAMSYALPVICPRSGLLQHLVVNEENGFSYEEGGLLSAMRMFLRSAEQLGSRVGQQALRTAKSFRWEDTAEKIRLHFEGSDFGVPKRISLPSSNRLWFVRGDLENLRKKTCVAVVLHYRDVEDTKRCISKLMLQGDDLGIIAISNSETVEDAKVIANAFPGIVAVQSEGNIGYAAANNFGIWACRQIKPEYFWILNPDIDIPAEYLREMVGRAQGNQRNAFFGSTLVAAHAPSTVLFCGGEVRLDQGGKPSHLHMGKMVSELPSGSFECDYLTGANIFGRTSALERIGYMPEQYFLYFEETDWFVSYTKKTGERPMIYPDLIARNHKKSEADGLPARHYLYYFCRNSLLFGERFAPMLREECEKEARKFAGAWLEKVSKRAPQELKKYQYVVERAFEDGRKGVSGKATFTL